ncbi:endonuclease/exonuclease/phosphatase family protein [Muricauda sp. NFXS6]|uniref:endonuclease/exonuclease/phosphatase family protein n=1 Tax=Allomuricauda sp. NFXS6 TaxID=2819094 RepID=UPI0032DFCA6E
MKKSTSIWDKVVFAINLLVAFLLILTGVISYVPLQFFSAISVLSLVVPFLFALNTLLLLYWIARLKRKFLVSFVAILLGYLMFGIFYRFGDSGFAQKKPSDLSVMSYNVWHFNINGWIRQPKVGDSIINFIKSKDPDVLLIQEHSRRRYKQLEQYKYRSETPHSDRVTQAIFSKYPIVNSGSFDLPNTGNNIIYADVLFKKDTIRFYNLHLESFKIIPSTDNFSDGEKYEKTYKRLVVTFSKQMEQAEIFRNHLNKSPYRNIVCGDFNNTQFSNVYKIVNEGLQDTFLEKGKGFGRTYDLWKIPLRIDYILADPEFEVLSHHNYDERLSDHYPIMATLRLKSHQ